MPYVLTLLLFPYFASLYNLEENPDVVAVPLILTFSHHRLPSARHVLGDSTIPRCKKINPTGLKPQGMV